METEKIIAIIVIALFVVIIYLLKKRKEKQWDVFEHRDKTNNKILYKFMVNRITGEKKILE